jgi:hypothetical protein
MPARPTAGIRTISFGDRITNLKNRYSPGFTIQKLNYIHNNPVEAGIVDKAEEYVYSSARESARWCSKSDINFKGVTHIIYFF